MDTRLDENAAAVAAEAEAEAFFVPTSAPAVAAVEDAMHAASVRDKAVAGIKALGARTLFTLIVRIFSSMAMARMLLPRDYGIYAVAAWIAGIGMFLSDVGLAGALVRQHTKPTKDESVTVFVMQQALTGLIVFFIAVFAPQIVAYCKLPAASGLLVRVMAFGLFDCSLRTIPMMALERELRFGVIARIDLLQSVVATASTLLLAWRGWGAWSMGLGSMISAGASLVAVWIASPWMPSGRFRWSIVARLARFGLPFQLNALAPTLLSGWVPVIVGRLLGISALGFVNWAGNLAAAPLMLSGVLNRVAFPSYARLQSDPAALGRFLASSMRRLFVLMTIPLTLGILLSPLLIPLIFRSRWQPAVPVVQWFSFDTMMTILTGIIAAAQNATGRPGDRLCVATVAGVGRWIVGFSAISLFGLAGVGPAAVIMGVGELTFSVWLLRRRNPETQGLLSQLLWRLGALGTSLFIANLIGNAIGAQRVLGAAAALASFACLAGLWSMVTPESLVPWKELTGTLSMLRGRKA